MSININTGAGYVGEVTLTYIVDDKKIKVKKYNKGWSRLFQFIARSLSSDFNTGVGRPKFLDIKCRAQSPDAVWETCLFNYVPVSASLNYWDDISMNNYGGVNYYATLTATISFNMINKAILDGYISSDDCALFLLSEMGDGVTPSTDSPYRMAQLLLDISSLKSVNPGTQVIVEWNLKFFNKE